MDGQGNALKRFRSPLRVLAASFQRSRDRWKQKCMDVKAELKRLKVRVSDVGKSRDAWRDKAETKQRQLEALQSQVQSLQEQLSEVQSHREGDDRHATAAEQKMSRPPRKDSSRCRTIPR